MNLIEKGRIENLKDDDVFENLGLEVLERDFSSFFVSNERGGRATAEKIKVKRNGAEIYLLKREEKIVSPYNGIGVDLFYFDTDFTRDQAREFLDNV